jgi:hypothetical protein
MGVCTECGGRGYIAAIGPCGEPSGEDCPECRGRRPPSAGELAEASRDWTASYAQALREGRPDAVTEADG